ncbi:MAG: hypothetical protein ACRDQA_26570 [Nocardioidaceae bacterium]
MSITAEPGSTLALRCVFEDTAMMTRLCKVIARGPSTVLGRTEHGERIILDLATDGVALYVLDGWLYGMCGVAHSDDDADRVHEQNEQAAWERRQSVAWERRTYGTSFLALAGVGR